MSIASGIKKMLGFSTENLETRKRAAKVISKRTIKKTTRKAKRASATSLEHVDSAIGILSGKSDATDNEVLSIAKGPIAFGIWTLIIVTGFAFIWGGFAPIDSAAIAQGYIKLDANRKTIQHLEGGIIEEIMVRDGDFVEEGSLLMKLSPTAASARQELLAGQLRTAVATEIRLIAERDGDKKLVFNHPLLEDRNNPEVSNLIDNQNRLFDTRNKSYSGQIDVLRQRIEQLKEEISGLSAQEHSTRDQLKLIKEEVTAVKKLYSKGLIEHSRLLALQRKEAELDGNRGELLARIAQAKQAITETDLEILNVKNKVLNEIVAELKETQVTISDLEERSKASTDILNRINIVAPYAGIVTGLNYHTVGGVIAPGAAIMDIIPQDDKLIIEARVNPRDIDIVRAGLEAKVMLSAFKARSVPRIDGEVTYVSPDRFTDQNTGEPYYVATVEVDESMMDRLTTENIQLYPGMPADVFIVTGSRTFLQYLLSPFSDSMKKAFREQ